MIKESENMSIVERLIREKNQKDSIAIECNFIEFRKEYEQITKILGNEGVIMLSENIAIGCYDKYSQIKIYIKNNKKLNVEDFEFVGTKVKLIGERREDSESFFNLLIADILRLFPIIVVTSVIYFFLFLSNGADLKVLNSFDELLITVFSIFIATIFVFIGMFYGDKERCISIYRKGLCDKEYNTDKYVIKLSFISLFLLICSFVITGIESISFSNEIIERIVSKVGVIDEYNVSLVLTFIPIIFAIICFDALINYYLRTCRNEFFIDAVKKEIEERKRKL